MSKLVIQILMGAGFQSFKLIRMALKQYPHATPDNLQTLREYFQDGIKNKKPIANLVDEILNLAADLGIKIPRQMLMFCRGRVFLETQINEIIKQDPGCSIETPMEIYEKVFLKNLNFSLK